MPCRTMRNTRQVLIQIVLTASTLANKATHSNLYKSMVRLVRERSFKEGRFSGI